MRPAATTDGRFALFKKEPKSVDIRTPETALRLGRYFGTSPESWLNLQQRYDLRVVRRECEAEIRKTVQPAKS